MKINSLNKTEINFNAGLNNKILLKELVTSVRRKETLCKGYDIFADFRSNKAVALMNELCVSIFEDLSKKLKINLTPPPFIRVYNKNEMVTEVLSQMKYVSFCIPDVKNVLKGEANYPPGSIFFKNYKNLKEIDKITEDLYAKKKISTNHFMSIMIHEWLHSIHLDYIFTKYGYPGENAILKKIYPASNPKNIKSFQELENLKLSDKELEVIAKELGYSCKIEKNQYFEIFSDFYTKILCTCLSKDCKSLVKNPIDLIKELPKEVQEILKKITNME